MDMRIPPMQNNPSANTSIDNFLKLKDGAQKNVVAYANRVLEKSKQFSSIKDKMDAIDIAYARYSAAQKRAAVDGTDPMPAGANVACDVFATEMSYLRS